MYPLRRNMGCMGGAHRVRELCGHSSRYSLENTTFEVSS